MQKMLEDNIIEESSHYFFFSLHPKIPEFLEQAILGTAKYTVSPDTLIALGYWLVIVCSLHGSVQQIL